MMLVHFQAKESNPVLVGRCHMQSHAQGEAHLTHRRRGRDDDQVRTLPSSGEGIEILQTRGNASHLAPYAWAATPGSDTGGDTSCFLDGSSPRSCRHLPPPPRPSARETMSSKRLQTILISALLHRTHV